MNIGVKCDEYDGIYVEYGLRVQPGKEHCIGRCVTTSVQPSINITNSSESDIILTKNYFIARG